MYAAIDEIKDKLALHCGLNHIIYILFRSDQVIFKTQFFFFTVIDQAFIDHLTLAICHQQQQKSCMFYFRLRTIRENWKTCVVNVNTCLMCR